MCLSNKKPQHGARSAHVGKQIAETLKSVERVVESYTKTMEKNATTSKGPDGISYPSRDKSQ
jgi:hypothetical protein